MKRPKDGKLVLYMGGDKGTYLDGSFHLDVTKFEVLANGCITYVNKDGDVLLSGGVPYIFTENKDQPIPQEKKYVSPFSSNYFGGEW